MDRITPQQRSDLMRAVRGRDTTPERVVRQRLHRLGFRFRIGVRELPGRPDIVLPKWRTVIFVHGCFWHRHPRCRKATTPATRRAFWEAKFAANRERDRRHARSLRRQGWRVLVVWECQTQATERLDDWLKKRIADA